jgi:hypothetical protein
MHADSADERKNAKNIRVLSARPRPIKIYSIFPVAGN